MDRVAKLAGPEFGLQGVECLIDLQWLDDGKPDRARSQVGKLQPLRVRLLVGDHNRKGVGLLTAVVAITDTPKRQFDIVVFFFPACLAYHVRRRTGWHPLGIEESAQTLKPVLQPQVVGMNRLVVRKRTVKSS